MNFMESIKNGKIGSMFKSVGAKISQSKPELMLVGGGISVLAGTIWACFQTEKAKKVVEETKEKTQVIENKLKIEPEEGIDINPETVKRLKIERGRNYIGIYGHMIYEFLKLYGLPAILWFGGMGLITGSHVTLRKMNGALAADIFAGNKLFQEYRDRVKKAVGDEVENKIYLGAQEGMVNVLETDPETGKETIRQEKADVFYAQPGSIFARNFTEETTDILYRDFTDEYLENRVKMINRDLEIGIVRAYNGLDILRKLGYNETALGENEAIDKLLSYGISGNARKVPDPEMRKLKITKLRGYHEKYDVARNIKVYVPCLRVDFNFYPLEGKI